MKKSEIKNIILAGGGMSLNAEDYSIEELANLLNSTKAFVVVDVPISLTYREILRLAKEGSGHVFFTGDRIELDKSL